MYVWHGNNWRLLEYMWLAGMKRIYGGKDASVPATFLPPAYLLKANMRSTNIFALESIVLLLFSNIHTHKGSHFTACSYPPHFPPLQSTLFHAIITI